MLPGDCEQSRGRRFKWLMTKAALVLACSKRRKPATVAFGSTSADVMINKPRPLHLSYGPGRLLRWLTERLPSPQLLSHVTRADSLRSVSDLRDNRGKCLSRKRANARSIPQSEMLCL
jgi:hypothetical protein